MPCCAPGRREVSAPASSLRHQASPAFEGFPGPQRFSTPTLGGPQHIAVRTSLCGAVQALLLPTTRVTVQRCTLLDLSGQNRPITGHASVAATQDFRRGELGHALEFVCLNEQIFASLLHYCFLPYFDVCLHPEGDKSLSPQCTNVVAKNNRRPRAATSWFKMKS